MCDRCVLLLLWFSFLFLFIGLSLNEDFWIWISFDCFIYFIVFCLFLTAEFLLWLNWLVVKFGFLNWLCLLFWIVLLFDLFCLFGFWLTWGVSGTRRHPVYPGWKKEAKDRVDDSSVPKKGKVGLHYCSSRDVLGLCMLPFIPGEIERHLGQDGFLPNPFRT